MALRPIHKPVLLVSLLLIFSCASPTPIETEPRPWEVSQDRTPVEPKDSVVPNYPKPTETIQEPSQPRRGVTLVFGGAGVASFATVGILKKLHEEKIPIDWIITTGWPTLFVMAHGFLSTIHEVEWFATRLTEKDFYKATLFDAGFSSHENLGKLIEGAFKQREIQEAKTKIVISAANTEYGEAEIFDRGEWRDPLLKTMSVPGLIRPYPATAERESILSLQGLDVGEAKRRSRSPIVAIYMYDDYLRHIATTGKRGTETLFRKLYQAQFRKSLGEELRGAQITAKIELFKPPTDFSAKRSAILAGYHEGGRIAEAIREGFRTARP